MRRVRCEASGVLVPKDKAIRRFIVRNIVDASAIRDITDASVIDSEFSGAPARCHAPLAAAESTLGGLAAVQGAPEPVTLKP